MQTVELLPDARLDDGVRNLWNRLRDAGLPSLATHPHPTNRPHLTVLTARSIVGLPPLPLPLPVELGEVRMLGRALVRLVTPTAELRHLHAGVWSALDDPEAWPGPANWLPHVSLALRAPEEALALLGTLPAERGLLLTARSYDTDTRTVSPLETTA